ncbi:transglycosylase SLT domain-containing protein [Candidatus Peregrinibacteria bacterium]|nr:transglycosylase SLT domain-containing protein [Candidatus Peregrinibacteria bacterium]
MVDSPTNVGEIQNPELEGLQKQLDGLQVDKEQLSKLSIEKKNELHEKSREMFGVVGRNMEEIMKQAKNAPEGKFKPLKDFLDLREKYKLSEDSKYLFQTKGFSEIVRKSDPESLLASVATLTTQTVEGKGILVYEAEFPAGTDALQNVGLGDILPIKYKFVRVWKEGSDVPIWGRRGSGEFRGQNRNGYVDESGKYIPIVNGDRFEPFERLPSSPSVAKVGETPQNSLGIPAPFATLKETDFPDAAKEQELREKYANSLEEDELLQDYFSEDNRNIDVFTTQYTKDHPGYEFPKNVMTRIRLVEDFVKPGERLEDKIPTLSSVDILQMRKDWGGWEVMESVFKSTKILHIEKSAEVKSKIATAVDSLPNENNLVHLFGKEDLKAVMIAIANNESGFQPFEISTTGCMGIFQFNRGNTEDLHLNPFNIDSSIEGFLKLWEANYNYHENELSKTFTLTENLQDALIVSHYAGVGRTLKSQWHEGPSLGKIDPNNPQSLNDYRDKIRGIMTNTAREKTKN